MPTDSHLLEALLDESADAMLVLSPEGSVLFCNRGAESIFRRPRDQAQGCSLSELFCGDPEHNVKLCEALGRALADGRAHFDTVRDDENGAGLQYSVSMRAAVDTPGMVQFVTTHIRDVTSFQRAIRDVSERKRAEETFRRVMEAAPDAMLMVDPEGLISLANLQTEKLFGYRREDLLQQPVEMLMPQRFRSRHRGHRTNYFGDRRVRAMGSGLELYGLHQDGSEFPVEISLSPLDTPEGSFVLVSIRDVSERRKADELRFRLAAIVDSSEDAIVSKTLGGVVTSWNRGAERIFGYSAQEMLGQPLTVLLPEDRLDEETLLLEQLRSGTRVESIDTLRRCKDGRIIDVSVTISLVRDSAGNVVGASKVARDISPRKRAEKELTRAKEAAEVASRELEAFSYSVAHDLRAPLRGIDGFSKALLDNAERLDERGRGYLARVRQSAQYMAELIDNLLMLSSVTQQELGNERVDFSEVAWSALARLRNVDSERVVDVVVEEDLEVEGDARLLCILLDNLLGNAWKFTQKKSRALIEFGRTPGEGHPTYFVRDNGAGFDMAFSSKLFGVFQRLHGSKEFPGTGIGLATVQRIVRRHGGRVWAEGEVDKGATFYFTLGETEKV